MEKAAMQTNALSPLTSVEVLRRRAREDIEKGAVTAGYAANREEVVRLLNEALATELVCVLRYRRHYYAATGIHSDPVKAEFLQHSNEELGHSDVIAQRIIELGGAPDYSPDGLTARSHAEYVEGDSLKSMIVENLVAERVAIDSYRELVAYLEGKDPTTQRLIKEILTNEESHAEELASLLDDFKN